MDDETKSPRERVANFRKYLESINFESQGMGTIDQAVADWAREQGFPEAAMGGRRHRKGTKRSKGRNGRTGRKTRSYKK